MCAVCKPDSPEVNGLHITRGRQDGGCFWIAPRDPQGARVVVARAGGDDPQGRRTPRQLLDGEMQGAIPTAHQNPRCPDIALTSHHAADLVAMMGEHNLGMNSTAVECIDNLGHDALCTPTA